MFKITELMIYKVIFVIEILVSMHLFSSKLIRKNKYNLRLTLSILVTLLISILFPIFKNFSYSWWYSSLMFLILFVVCVASMFFVYDSSWQKLFFISITSYTIQHLAHEIYNIISLTLNMSGSTSGVYGDEIVVWFAPAFNFIVSISVFILVYAIAFIFLNKRINSYDDVRVNNQYILLIAFLILFTDIIFNSLVIYIKDGHNIIYSYTIAFYNLLCCFMVLFIQFSVMNNQKIQNQLQTTTQLLNQSKERYKENKENINLINMKCHDLRHQIREYGKRSAISPESIQDLEQMINIYDSNVKTGNETLDFILTEKSLLCQKKDITLTCLADCSKIGFIDDSDLYSLFGNAVDNAMEAVMKIQNHDKRNISLIVRNVENYLSISIENYYEGKINFGDDGLPLTTKFDTDYHGYGVKSIKYIVDKYHGTLSITTKNDIFKLYILFVL